MFERLKKTAARLKVTVRSKTYIVIVAAVLILLNTYPLVVSEKLAYQSKQASMLNQASVWPPPWPPGRRPLRPRVPPGRWSCCGAAWE